MADTHYSPGDDWTTVEEIPLTGRGSLNSLSLLILLRAVATSPKPAVIIFADI